MSIKRTGTLDVYEYEDGTVSHNLDPAKKLSRSGTVGVAEYDDGTVGYIDQPAEPPTRSWPRAAADTALSVGQGAVDLGKSAVGLLDIPTGNLVGEGLAQLGYGPDATNQYLESLKSEKMRQANERVEQATGVLGTMKALVTEPTTIVDQGVRAAPGMLGIAGVTRKAALKMGAEALKNPKNIAKLALISGAVEGAQSAGDIQETTRAAGVPWQKSVLPAVGAGAGVAATSILTSKIPGLGDAEVALATRGLREATKKGALEIPKAFVKGAIKEGPLEEGTQSIIETGAQNIALGRPTTEGMGRAWGQGTVLGGALGGTMTAVGATGGKRPPAGAVDVGTNQGAQDAVYTGQRRMVELGLTPKDVRAGMDTYAAYLRAQRDELIKTNTAPSKELLAEMAAFDQTMDDPITFLGTSPAFSEYLASEKTLGVAARKTPLNLTGVAATTEVLGKGPQALGALQVPGQMPGTQELESFEAARAQALDVPERAPAAPVAPPPTRAPRVPRSKGAAPVNETQAQLATLRNQLAQIDEKIGVTTDKAAADQLHATRAALLGAIDLVAGGKSAALDIPVTEPVATPVVETPAPVAAPAAPVAAPAAPVAAPAAPVAAPAAPVMETPAPVVEVVPPVAAPTAPVAAPTAPVAAPTAPVVERVKKAKEKKAAATPKQAVPLDPELTGVTMTELIERERVAQAASDWPTYKKVRTEIVNRMENEKKGAAPAPAAQPPATSTAAEAPERPGTEGAVPTTPPAVSAPVDLSGMNVEQIRAEVAKKVAAAEKRRLAEEKKAEADKAAAAVESEARQKVIAGFNDMSTEALIEARDTMAEDSPWRGTVSALIDQRARDAGREVAAEETPEQRKIRERLEAETAQAETDRANDLSNYDENVTTPEPAAAPEPAIAEEPTPEISPEEKANRKRISDEALAALVEMDTVPGKAGYIRIHKMAKELFELGVLDEFSRDAVLEEKNANDARDVLEEWLRMEHGDIGKEAEKFSVAPAVAEEGAPPRPEQSFDRAEAEKIAREEGGEGFTFADDATMRTPWGARVRGFYKDGTKGINLAEMVDADMVRRIVRHEVTHERMTTPKAQEMLGKYVREQLDWGTLVKTAPGYPLLRLKDGSIETQDAYMRRVVDEHLAKVSETREKNPKAWDRLVQRVKEFLAATGMRNLTREEAEEAILWRLEKGTGRTGPGGETRYELADDIRQLREQEKDTYGARKQQVVERRLALEQQQRDNARRSKEPMLFGGDEARYSIVEERRIGDPARRKLIDDVAAFQVRSINELWDMPEEKLKAVHQYLLDREKDGTISRDHGPLSADRFASADDVLPRIPDAVTPATKPRETRTYEDNRLLTREGILRNLTAMQDAATGDRSMWKGLLGGLPGALSELHLRAAEKVGALIGQKSHVLEQAHVDLEKIQEAFAKLGIGAPDVKLDDNVGVKFMSAIQKGDLASLPADQRAMAETIAKYMKVSYGRALVTLLSDPQMTVPRMAERMLGSQLKTSSQAKGEDHAAYRKRAEAAAMDALSELPEFKPQFQESKEKYLVRIRPLVAQQILEQETGRNYFPNAWTPQSRAALNQALEEMRREQMGEEESKEQIDVLALDDDEKLALRNRVEELLKQGRGINDDVTFAAAFARRPIEGKKGFLKQRTYQNVMDGIEVGLQPFSKNPVDMANHKLVELEQFVLGRTIRNGARFFPSGKDFHKPGERVPKDPSFTLTEPSGRIIGRYYVSNELADVVDSYMSPTLYQHPNQFISGGYKKLMHLGSLLNQSQLGWGSWFHAGFMYSEASVSAWANVAKDSYRFLTGKLGSAQLARTTSDAVLNLLPGHAYVKGKDLVEAWKRGTTDEFMQKIVRAYELGGGRFEMERGLVTNDLMKAKEIWHGKDYGKLVKDPLLMLGAITERLSQRVMKDIVPKHKAAVFTELAARIIRDNPGKSLEELTPEFRQAVNRVDARLGQVGYDRLFLDNVVKNVVQVTVRAPGWTGGTIAEIAGGGKDTVKFLKDWKKNGKMPEQLPDRFAYTFSLITVVTALNAGLTMMFTGDGPDDLTDQDFWAFRTGGFDEKGRPERFLLPTYLKDVKSYREDPGKTLTHKIHPIWSAIKQAVDNKDYYGREIMGADDNWAEKMGDLAKFGAKQFFPFWMQGAGRTLEREGGSEHMFDGSTTDVARRATKVASPFVGVAPAPASYIKTKAEKLLDEYANSENTKPLGKIAAERRDLRSKLRREVLLHGDRGPLVQARAEGKLTGKELREIVKSRKETSLVFGVKHQNLTINEALRVYAVATPKEKELLRPIINTKYRRALKNTPRLYQQELRDQYNEVFNAENK